MKCPGLFGAIGMWVGLMQRGEARDKLGKVGDVKSSWFSLYSTEVGHCPQGSGE